MSQTLPLPPRINLDSRATASHELSDAHVQPRHWDAVVLSLSGKELEFCVSVRAEGRYVLLELKPHGASADAWAPIGDVHVTLDWSGAAQQGEGFIDRFLIKARSIMRGLTTPEVAKAILAPYGEVKWQVCKGCELFALCELLRWELAGAFELEDKTSFHISWHNPVRKTTSL